VHRVAGAVERADAEAVGVEAGAKLAPRLRALEHAVEVHVRRGRPVAACEFQHVHLEPRGDLEHGVKVGLRQAVGDHSDFHGRSNLKETEGNDVTKGNEQRRSRNRSTLRLAAAPRSARAAGRGLVPALGRGRAQDRLYCGWRGAKAPRKKAMKPQLNERILQFDSPFRRLDELLAAVTPEPSKKPIVMSVGEPQDSPPALLADTVAANAHLWNRYPHAVGTPEFRCAAAGYLNRRYSGTQGGSNGTRRSRR
jgi:hypothetical protein